MRTIVLFALLLAGCGWKQLASNLDQQTSSLIVDRDSCRATLDARTQELRRLRSKLEQYERSFGSLP
jgi:uncharacterized protein YcfL